MAQTNDEIINKHPAKCKEEKGWSILCVRDCMNFQDIVIKQEQAKARPHIKAIEIFINADSIGTAMTMQQRYLSKVLSEYKRESK